MELKPIATSTHGTCVEVNTSTVVSLVVRLLQLRACAWGARMSGNPHVLKRESLLCFTETCIDLQMMLVFRALWLHE